MSLHRYFIWANRMRTHFDELLVREAQRGGESFTESLLYMSYWYGGLYVVIDGWRILGLTDAKIDALLRSPNVRLLEAYRNGVFHYQRRYFDRKFLNLITKGRNVVDWVRELNRELGRFFLDWVRRQPTAPRRS